MSKQANVKFTTLGNLILKQLNLKREKFEEFELK